MPTTPAPVAVRYVGPLGEVYNFPALDGQAVARRVDYKAGVPVELTPTELEVVLRHPDFEPVTARELADYTKATAAPAETPQEN